MTLHWSAALTSTLHWFETELLTREENLVGLMAVNRELIGQAETFGRADRIVLDMDSSESPVHGAARGSRLQRETRVSVCYHPLFCLETLPGRSFAKQSPQAAHWMRLSCQRFRANEVRLQLSVLAYNLGNLWRRLVLPARIDTWSLTSLQQRLVKTGGRLVKHARYYWLLLAESRLTRRLFGSMLRRIWALPVPTG
jgi:hypothetical protein